MAAGGAAIAALAIGVAVVCAIVAVVDHRRGIIPDGCNIALAALGGLRAAVEGWPAPAAAALGAVVAAALLLLLRSLHRRLRGRLGLGLGDVKFLAAATLWTGLAGLPLLILAACASGLTEALLRLARRERVGAATALRFGPHLALAFTAYAAADAAGLVP